LSGHRRSDRIDMAIPIQVIGMELSTGQTFCKETETRVISRHGASLVLKAALSIDDELTIRCLATNQETKCRVVGLIRKPGGELVYGIAFVEPDTDLWGIEFPALNGTESGLARMLLACGTCQAQEVAHLNEIEMEVFEANRSLQRFCRPCSTITSWKHGGTDKPGAVQKMEHASAKPAEQSSQPATNRRKHGRIRTSVLGCVRSAGAEELVTCEDISRGGVSFRTTKLYAKHAQVQVAVPCAKGTANIFVPARVAHVRQSGNSYLVGVAYETASVSRNLADRL
jgi:hypothetical protein